MPSLQYHVCRDAIYRVRYLKYTRRPAASKYMIFALSIPTMMTLRGQRIIQLRKEQGMTQYDLADALGISQNQISRYERGAFNPSVETLADLARVLNTTPDYLLGFSNTPHPDAPPAPAPDLTEPQAELLALMARRDLAAQRRLVRAIKLLWDDEA